MATKNYVVGAIDKDLGKYVIDINPIVESSCYIDEENNLAWDENKKNYSSQDILQNCVEYMSTVPFITFRSSEPENKLVGIWMDVSEPVPERTYAKNS